MNQFQVSSPLKITNVQRGGWATSIVVFKNGLRHHRKIISTILRSLFTSMHHHMKLQSEPFQKIRSGAKQIEIRLFDEKRQKLNIDDVITFTEFDDASKSVQARIVDLVRFDSFKELCETYAPECYGSVRSDEYEGMYTYYSREDEEKYGVLAIHVRVV